jgi:phospholipase/lecithinase/hemolysin
MKFLLTFGDSFSDNGFSSGCGFNRLSNGRVWVEYLSEMLGVPLEDRAWCGAQSGVGNASGPSDWSGLAWQVATYPADAKTPDALCTLLIGINDVYDGRGTAGTVAANTVSAVEMLIDKGVRRFLIANLPDISRAPAYGTPEYSPLTKTVNEAVVSINNRLKIDLFGQGGLASRHPEIDFVSVDAFGLFNRLVAGEAFETTDAPWNATYAYPYPDSHLWWDEWHPMTEAHRLLALASLDALEKRYGTLCQSGIPGRKNNP